MAQWVEAGTRRFILGLVETGANGCHPGIHQAVEALSGEGLEVVLRLIPPPGNYAVHLEAVEHTYGYERTGEGRQQLGAHIHEVTRLREGGEARLVSLPPSGEGHAHLGLSVLHAGVLLDGVADSGASGEGRRKVVVVRVALDEDGGGVEAVGVEETFLVLDLGLGDATEEVGADVL